MDPQDSSCIVYLSKEDKKEGEIYEGDDYEAPTVLDWHGQHLNTDSINSYPNVDTLMVCAGVGRYKEETRSYEDLEFGDEFPTLTLKLKRLFITSQCHYRCVDLNGILGLKDTLRSLTLRMNLTNQKAISELKNLESLELELIFKDKDRNLEFLEGCTKLQKLELFHYPINKVEIVDLSPIASLTALKSLSLSLSGFCGLELLDQPLKSIYIGSSIGYCSMDMHKLPNLQSLESLELNHILAVDKAPVDLGFLSDAPHLKELTLSNIDITNFEALSMLAELKHLTTETCFEIKNIKPLSGLKLESLILAPCTVKDISPLRDMTTLKTLNLDGLNIPDCSVIATLTSLETLHFCCQEELELHVIGELKQLKTLYLPSGRIRSGIMLLRDIESVVHETIEVLTMTDEGERWVTYYEEKYYDSVYTTGKQLVDAITAIPNFYDPSSGFFTKRA
jgi:hypothetical protein